MTLAIASSAIPADAKAAYAAVLHHAYVCMECGHGQVGDRGVALPREAYPSQAAYEAAKKEAFDAGRGWDGRTFVLAPADAAIECPNGENHPGAVKLSESDQLRAELADLKAQFAALASGHPVEIPAPTPIAAAPATPATIDNLADQLKALNAPAAG